MKARFHVLGRLDGAALAAGTVTIDRAAGLFTVRPMRRRRVYALPLSTVADIVVARICKLEAAEKKAAKAARRAAK